MPTGLWLYSYLALWFVLMFTSALIVLLLRQMTALHSYWVKNDPTWGLPLGSRAPMLSGTDLYGRSVALGASEGKKTLLFFVSPGCSSCERALNLLPAVHRMDNLRLVLAVGGSELKTRLYVEQKRPQALFPDVLILPDPDRDIADQYQAAAVPYVVVVDEEGRLGAKGAGASMGEQLSFFNQTDELRSRRLSRVERETSEPTSRVGASTF